MVEPFGRNLEARPCGRGSALAGGEPISLPSGETLHFALPYRENAAIGMPPGDSKPGTEAFPSRVDA